MRIAVMGSAPSTVALAPYQNSDYAKWVKGKVRQPGRRDGEQTDDWEIWACSPGCWGVAPRIDRFFEVHRWEPGQAWFSPEYCQFLRDFKGPLYVGARIPELPHATVYPLDEMEAKFSSYFFTSSLSLMLALAIDTIDKIRAARNVGDDTSLPLHVDPSVIDESDEDDVIGLWGVDMAAMEEWAAQRPGCQFFLLEAMRRGIGVFLPKESDLMRPMPVYGISEWDHNYVKLTSRARELNQKMQEAQKAIQEGQTKVTAIQGELNALQHFVNTWTSPYGMQHGLIVRQTPGTGLGGGITHLDARPIERLNVAEGEKGNGQLPERVRYHNARSELSPDELKVLLGDGDRADAD